MTYQQIINLASTKYDDYANPFFDTDRTLALLYDAIMEFVNNTYKEGELDEQKKQQLLPLVKPANPVFINSTVNGFAVATVAEVQAVLPGFMYVYDLGGMFKNPCGTDYIFQPIVPLKIDKFNRALQDSFDSPNDEYPKYKSVNNQILIYSVSPPSSISMDYIKLPFQPGVGDLGNNPDLPSSTHNAIAAILESKFDEASEKLVQLQFAQQQAQLQD